MVPYEDTIIVTFNQHTSSNDINEVVGVGLNEIKVGYMHNKRIKDLSQVLYWVDMVNKVHPEVPQGLGTYGAGIIKGLIKPATGRDSSIEQL
jgi:hypothetical protein